MIIADTGFWLALANERDRHHAAAVNAFRELSEDLVTTWPVLTETCHMLATRLGAQALERFVSAALAAHSSCSRSNAATCLEPRSS